jgi:Xaa-Pro aminopeptidase
MDFAAKVKEVQSTLFEEGIGGWLLYDYHRSNSLACSFLEIPEGKMVSRRFFYWIPQKGEPIKIVPQIEPYTLDHLPGLKWVYRGWQELERILFSIGAERLKIAMEYSPYNALPNVSKVDAGVIELMRKTGAEVVSSANLLQRYTCVWSPQQVESHLMAAHVLDSVVGKTWAFIEHALQVHSPIDEFQVQQFILREIDEAGCETADLPICAVNAHSADPHYSPTSLASHSIHKGDFILLDLWCKKKGSHAVYADITRVGVASPNAGEKEREIFKIVKEARDKATDFIRDRYENHLFMQGWQVDQICRDHIQESGYGEFFIHRTGHNIGEEVHGAGANLDNFETHDYRELLPGTAFSVEPGIYLPDQFGVRLEYDIYLHPAGHIEITGGIQTELVCLQV